MATTKWITAIQVFRNGTWSPDQEFDTKRLAEMAVKERIRSAERQQLDRRNWALANFATGAFIRI
jgi:hypothetical protein